MEASAVDPGGDDGEAYRHGEEDKNNQDDVGKHCLQGKGRSYKQTVGGYQYCCGLQMVETQIEEAVV